MNSRRPGPGPAHRPGVGEPLVGPAHRELGLGRAVELPHGARADPRHGRPLHRGRAGGAGVGQEAQGAERLVGRRARAPAGSAGGGSGPGRRWSAAAGAARRAPSTASNRLRMASEPPESSVPAAKRTDTVWYIGEQTMWRSVGVELPHGRLVVEDGLRGAPRPTPRWSPPWAARWSPRCSASGRVSGYGASSAGGPSNEARQRRLGRGRPRSVAASAIRQVPLGRGQAWR